MFYYCDEYAAYQNLDNEILDSEGYNRAEREFIDEYYHGQKLNISDVERAHRKEQRLTFQRDYRLLEFSEPDWCVYHAKVATRFMCGAKNSNLQKALKSERKSLRKKTVQYSDQGLNNTMVAQSVEFENHT